MRNENEKEILMDETATVTTTTAKQLLTKAFLELVCKKTHL